MMERSLTISLSINNDHSRLKRTEAGWQLCSTVGGIGLTSHVLALALAHGQKARLKKKNVKKKSGYVCMYYVHHI